MHFAKVMLLIIQGSPNISVSKPPGYENIPTSLPKLDPAGLCKIDEWSCYSAVETF